LLLKVKNITDFRGNYCLAVQEYITRFKRVYIQRWSTIFKFIQRIDPHLSFEKAIAHEGLFDFVYRYELNRPQTKSY